MRLVQTMTKAKAMAVPRAISHKLLSGGILGNRMHLHLGSPVKAISGMEGIGDGRAISHTIVDSDDSEGAAGISALVAAQPSVQ